MRRTVSTGWNQEYCGEEQDEQIICVQSPNMHFEQAPTPPTHTNPNPQLIYLPPASLTYTIHLLQDIIIYFTINELTMSCKYLYSPYPHSSYTVTLINYMMFTEIWRHYLYASSKWNSFCDVFKFVYMNCNIYVVGVMMWDELSVWCDVFHWLISHDCTFKESLYSTYTLFINNK